LTLLASHAGAAAPAPSSEIPSEPGSLARGLVRADRELRTAISAWRSGPLPGDVARWALWEQRAEHKLAADAAVRRAVLTRLPRGLARDIRDDVEARRGLTRLTPPRPLSAFRVGRALLPDVLERYYREAERRSGVDWQVLAAVNFVESAFGRVRETSVAGAQGPMQFMPATWASYGRGDVHDPHQSILAAGRFLRAAGWPDERRALFRYNPSWAYVDAIRRFAARIRRDSRTFRAYWARQLIVRTPSGERRLTSYGLG
jgi:membrane-bound lytic murein transglycosylase B